MARYELELEPWTASELLEGGLGLAFAKALLATRVICGIVSAQMGASIRPGWWTTTGDVRISRDFRDWYGGKLSLPEPAGGLLTISFEPLLWGQDDASSPVRLWILARGLTEQTTGQLYPVYLQMLTRANELLGDALAAAPVVARSRSDDWWMVLFHFVRNLPGRKRART